MRLRWLARTIGLVVLLTGAAPAADRALEYDVKAAFLAKFAPFVEWPSSAYDQPNAPFALCIVGADPFAEAAERAMAGQRVGEHPVVLRHLAVADAKSGCHLMFVAGSPAQSVAQALDAVRGTPTLTVTDSGTPGIIRFVVVDNRVNFDIDNAAAAANHLTISSKLLALAHAVNQGDRP